MQEWYTTFSATPGYYKSFHSGALAHCLFGDDLQGSGECRIIKIQGSAVTDRDPHAWLANYFYLPENFSSTLSFEPTISTFTLDFNLYVGLDEWVSGMFLRVYAPFVHTKWDLNMKEKVITSGTNTGNIFFTTPAQFFAGNT